MTEHAGPKASIGYDLIKVSRALHARHPAAKRFASLAQRYSSAESAKVDLQSAAKSIAMLIAEYLRMPQMKLVKQEERAAIGGQALFTNAVMMYSRATKTTGRQRLPSGIADKLPQEHRALHHEVTKLRDEVIAHVSGGGYGWQRETVLFEVDDQGGFVNLSAPYQRTNFSADLTLRMQDLVAAALSVVDEIILDRAGALVVYMRTFWLDPEFQSALLASHFDYSAFYGQSPDAKIWSDEEVRSHDQLHSMVPTKRYGPEQN